MICIIIENEFCLGYLIKISKREYLEDIIKGKIYFKEADFFRQVETDTSTDTREGKVRIDDLHPIDDDDAVLKLVSSLNPEELNISLKSSAKTPIFCCSLLESNMLVSNANQDYDLSIEYINEMKKWGTCVLVFSLDEFCSKIYQKCNELHINPIMDKVKYNRENIKISYLEYLQMITHNKYEPFFHKSKVYRHQHEFRIVLDGKDLISNLDHFILDIGKLESARILNLETLSDLGIKIIKYV